MKSLISYQTVSNYLSIWAWILSLPLLCCETQ